jgi:hypothetical protein
MPFDLSSVGGAASSDAIAGTASGHSKPANMAKSDREPVTGVTLENCYR